MEPAADCREPAGEQAARPRESLATHLEKVVARLTTRRKPWFTYRIVSLTAPTSVFTDCVIPRTSSATLPPSWMPARPEPIRNSTCEVKQCWAYLARTPTAPSFPAPISRSTLLSAE